MQKTFLAAATMLVAIVTSPAACAEDSFEIAEAHQQTGIATFYARKFEGRRTASGHTLRHAALTAAHPSFPFGTLARVTNLATGNAVIVRITDRLPSKRAIIDLTYAAAAELQMIRSGRARVSVNVLEWGPEMRSLMR